MQTVSMKRKPEVMRAMGRSHSSLYNDINNGLLTQPVRIGVQSVAWPDYEVDAVNRARIAGKSDDQIRALVAELHALRKAAA